jgi:choline dehydrogenase-like flavoprotein
MNFADDTYDLVLVGTGFASAFFLQRYLARAKKPVRVLVLERGVLREHAEHMTQRMAITNASLKQINNRTPAKPWAFQLTFGGGSNCWFGTTPRMSVEDFRLFSTYGQGRDWPITYDDLERFYCDAEDIIAVSGDSTGGPHVRSRPYPLPPHRFSRVDEMLQAAYPGSFFHQPCARPSREVPRRPRCCASGICSTCPINSKFTVLNELRDQFERDERVKLVFGANVTSIEHAGGSASGVHFLRDGKEEFARGNLIAIAANAVFNPYLLLRSGLDDGVVGRGIVEQVELAVDVLLDGVDNFQGSTASCGIGYMHHDGEHRRDHGAAQMLTLNLPMLRLERGKWRQRLRFGWVIEDLPQPHNRVEVDPIDGRPAVNFDGHSSYAQRSIDRLRELTPKVVSVLPVEKLTINKLTNKTSSHILCTTPMGDDPKTSVVDRNLVHHRVRNLCVLGSSTFPTCPTANPTLTLSALSLRCAEQLT